MKRVKMMLLSLALFAVVGGALAFKARYSQTFCTTNAILNAGVYTCTNPANGLRLTCPTSFQQKQIDLNPAAGNVPYCTSNFDPINKCVGNPCFEAPTSIVTD